ncbi:MAG: hypothetical protein WCL50_14415 [Spirochaetota bacterium]
MKKPRKSNKKLPINWVALKAEYLKGETALALATKHGINVETIWAHSKRHKWRAEQAGIARRVSGRVVEELVDEATAWVKDIKAACRGDMARLETLIIEQDPQMMRALVAARKQIDDIMRRALGLPDAPQEVKHSGAIDLAARIIQARKRAMLEDAGGGERTED